MKYLEIDEALYLLEQFIFLDFKVEKDNICFNVKDKNNKSYSLMKISFQDMRNNICNYDLDISFIKNKKDEEDFLISICYILKEILKDFISNKLDNINILDIDYYLNFAFKESTDRYNTYYK